MHLIHQDKFLVGVKSFSVINLFLFLFLILILIHFLFLATLAACVCVGLSVGPPFWSRLKKRNNNCIDLHDIQVHLRIIPSLSSKAVIKLFCRIDYFNHLSLNCL